MKIKRHESYTLHVDNFEYNTLLFCVDTMYKLIKDGINYDSIDQEKLEGQQDHILNMLESLLKN